jgi:hypothetical protein
MGGRDDCEFKVNKSSRKELSGELLCSGHSTNIQTKVISPKRQVSDIISSMGGAVKTKIRTISEWKSPVCPDGVTP